MILIERWLKAGCKDCNFVSIDGKRPDNWFQRYTVGQMKPNYPVPAVILEAEIGPFGTAIYEVRNGNYPCSLDIVGEYVPCLGIKYQY